MYATTEYYEKKIKNLELMLDTAILNAKRWQDAARAMSSLHRHKDSVNNCVSCGHQFPCATLTMFLDTGYEE